MAGSNAEERHGPQLNPQALRLADLARILSASCGHPVTVEMLEMDIADGAPTNPDGTINLVNFASWLVMEMARAN